MSPYLIAWITVGVLTILYGVWCRRLRSMGLMEMDVFASGLIVLLWPIVLPWLIGAHWRRGRKVVP